MPVWALIPFIDTSSVAGVIKYLSPKSRCGTWLFWILDQIGSRWGPKSAAMAGIIIAAFSTSTSTRPLHGFFLVPRTASPRWRNLRRRPRPPASRGGCAAAPPTWPDLPHAGEHDARMHRPMHMGRGAHVFGTSMHIMHALRGTLTTVSTRAMTRYPGPG